MAPAATARATAASTSGTARWIVTGDPPSRAGPTMPKSGNSSLTITVEPLIRRQAWTTLPSGACSRVSSSAPNARL